jgi:hypothetical protein
MHPEFREGGLLLCRRGIKMSRTITSDWVLAPRSTRAPSQAVPTEFALLGRNQLIPMDALNPLDRNSISDPLIKTRTSIFHYGLSA